VIQRENTVQFSIRVAPHIHEWLQDEARTHYRTLNAQVVSMLDFLYQEYGPGRKAAVQEGEPVKS
jgi:hypothetical protein